MSFSERLDKIVDAPFDLGAQAADFFFDAAVHTAKINSPIDALIESWKDNIMGMQSETGTGEKNVASALLGPEGVIGAPIGALPGRVRDPFSQLIWTPFMEIMQYSYKNFIDRPIGALATVERMVSSEIGGEDTNIFGRTTNLVEQLLPTGEAKLYNAQTYKQAWDVTTSRSAGQALALSIFHVDILDPKALEEAKGSDWYFVTSGVFDFAMNIGLDPAYLVARGARWGYAMRRAKETYKATGVYDANMLQTSLAPFEFRPMKPTRKGQQRLRDEEFWENWSYRPTFLDEPMAPSIAEVINSKGFDDFRVEIWNIAEETRTKVGRDVPSAVFEDNFGKAFIDAGKEGRLGKGWDRPADDMYTWGRTIGKVIGDGPITNESWLPFDNLFKLALAGPGGFPAIERQASLISAIMFQVDNLGGGRALFDEIKRLGNEIGELERRSKNSNDLEEVSNLDAQTQVLGVQQQALINKNPELMDNVMSVVSDALAEGETGIRGLAESIDSPGFAPPKPGTTEFNDMWTDLQQLSNMPWNATLSLKNLLVETLIKETPNGFSAPIILDKYATEIGGGVAKAAADEILSMHQIPPLPDMQIPYLGPMNRLGYKSKTFFEKSGTYRNIMGTNAVRMVVDKVAQNIIDLQQPSAAYIQVERMLRDVERIAVGEGNLLATAGLNADDVLIGFLNKSNDKAALQQHFDDVVEAINEAVVETFGSVVDDATGKAVKLSGNDLRKILDGQIFDSKELLNKAADDQIARGYGNVDYTEVVWEQSKGETIVRRIPISPGQMRKAQLVPRYDLLDRYIKMVQGDLKTVPTSTGPQKVSIAAERHKVMAARRMISTTWKRGVLLTPRWQMVVNVDSMLRNFAHLGVMESLAGFGNRMDTLRARWLQRAGADVQGVVLTKVDETLTRAGTDITDMSFVDRVRRYNETAEVNYNDLFESVVKDEYAKGRQQRRTLYMSGLGLFFAGPVGATAAGALYGVHARKSQTLLARRRVAEGYGQALLFDAKHMVDEIEQAERAMLAGLDDRSILDLDLMTPEEVAKLGEDSTLAEILGQAKRDRREAAKLLEARSEGVTDYQRMVVENFRKDQPEIAGRFDEAAELLSDIGYGQSTLGSNAIPNPWGDTPQLRGITERLNSANPTRRAIWGDTNAQTRRSERWDETHQYNIENEYEAVSFVRAWDDFMARHATSPGPAGQVPARDFWRQQWLGRSDDEVFEWLSTEGREVLNQLPEEFRSPGGRMELIRRTRYEANSLIPQIPEFAAVRKQLAEGQDVTWARDIQPVVDRMAVESNEMLAAAVRSGDMADIPAATTAGHVTALAVLEKVDGAASLNGSRIVSEAAKGVQEMSMIGRIRNFAAQIGADELQAMNNPAFTERVTPMIDFGKTVTDSSFMDGLKTGTQIERTKEIIRTVTDNWFENMTMVEDTLSRGTMFEAAYERAMAIEMQRLRLPNGKYRVSGDAVEQMSQRARRYALAETKKILYELADRTRFEEIATELFPFLGAWQEVASRWIGLAGENPVFVSRALRGWGLITGEDENGQSRIVIQVPKFMDATIGQMKLFGKLSHLANEDIDLNLKSASMIGALPGFGPLVSFSVSELIVKNPDIDESLGWMLPYGFVEGQDVYRRFLNSHTPSWVRNGAKAVGMTDEGRARTAARVTQDMITQYTEQGIDLPDTPEAIADFEAEVYRRTQAIYGIRMLRSIAVPVSFRQQSPYWGIISEYWRVQEEHSPEIADAWLLENHPDLWAFTARTTMSDQVRAGTLEGHANYKKHQEFIDTHPVLAGFVKGEIGATDIQFKYNRAVAELEEREGRRDYMNPTGILVEAAEAMGWREWRVFRNSIDNELRLRAQGGGSSSLLAKSNFDLWKQRRTFVEDLGGRNSQWMEDFNTFGQPDTQRKVLEGFRALLVDPTFAYRPEIPQIAMFVSKHDDIAYKMLRRAQSSNNRSYLRLSYSGNEDLRQEWDVWILQIKTWSDFGSIYDRYFSNMDTISVNNLPSTGIIEAEAA